MAIKNKTILILTAFIFLGVFLFVKPLTIQANTIQTLYTNNFDTSSHLNDWQPSPSYYWKWENQYYKVSIDGKNILTTSTLNVPNCDQWTTYSFSLLMRGDAGVDQHVDFYYQNSKNYYDLDIRWGGWVDSNNVYLAKVIDGHKTFLTPLTPFQLNQHQWYKIELTYEDPSHFKVFINNTLVLETTDPDNSFNGGCLRFRAWTGAAPSVVFKYDSLQIYKKSSLDPMVLLPGLGASWNRDIFLGNTGGQWTMTPFVHVYDNLIQTLENQGYQKDQNLFIWNYDWRRPVSEISSNFRQYLNSFVKPKIGNQSFYLVGHSLGGLVARNYLITYNDPQIKKIITLGSPHQGATNAYLTWAGGKLWEKGSWANLALEIYIHLNQPKYGNRANTIHSLAPVIKDLLPTYPYLENQDHTSINSTVTNNWLTNLNQHSPLTNIETIYGSGKTTLEKLTLGPTVSFWDRINGLWPDGEVINKTYSSAGDGTVLSLSAAYGNNPYQLSNQSHLNLISSQAGIEAILTKLNLSPTNLVLNTSPSPANSVIFIAHSPVHLQVRDSEGHIYGYQGNNSHVYYSSADKLLIIPNVNNSTNYQVTLLGQGIGHYTLDVGTQTTTGEVVWKTSEGEIHSNQNITYQLNYSPTSPFLELHSSIKEEDTLLSLINQIYHSPTCRHNRRLQYYLRATKRYLSLSKRYSATSRRYSYLNRARRLLTLFEAALNRSTRRINTKDLFWTKNKLEEINKILLDLNTNHPFYSSRYLRTAQRLEKRNKQLLSTKKQHLTQSTSSFKKYQLQKIDEKLNSLTSSDNDYIYSQLYYYYLLRTL